MKLVEQLEGYLDTLDVEINKLGYDTSYSLKGRELSKLYMTHKKLSTIILDQHKVIEDILSSVETKDEVTKELVV